MTTSNPFRSTGPMHIEERISIEPDGTVVARSGKVEFGQGIRTAFAKIVAEELDVPIENVRVELGETDVTPWDFGTFGSMSVATDGQSLRLTAACARAELVRRASERLRVRGEEIRTVAGHARSADGRSISYQELVASEPLTGVVPPLTVVRGASCETSKPFRIEAVAIVSGRACYVADVRLPGMRRGRVLAPPATGARLRALREESALAGAGDVRVVRDGDFVGVVADRDDQALLALRALEADWEVPDSVPRTPLDLVLREDSGFEAAFASLAREHRASFHVPHITHAPIGPSAAVADVRADGVDLYVATQRPFGVRDEVAELLSMPADRIHVHPRMASGTYGRNNVGDAALDAVRLSRAAGCPVLVTWSRADEFRRSPHRPELDAELRAALDEQGRIVAWHSDVRTNPHTYGAMTLLPQIAAMTAGRNAVPPYEIGRARVALRVVPAEIRTAAFRSLAASPNVFAIESFMDELAELVNADPIDFRLRHITDPRLRRVLETVRVQSGWSSRKKLDNHGLGVACAIYHGTYVAEVAELFVAPSGTVHLERVFCVADPGPLVHPDGGKNQLEGAIVQAASVTLLERLNTRHGAISSSSFEDYPIARFDDAPREIDVTFTPEPGVPSTGLGEPGCVPAPAAIANAVYAATGVRVRQLPISPEAIRSRLS